MVRIALFTSLATVLVPSATAQVVVGDSVRLRSALAPDLTRGVLRSIGSDRLVVETRDGLERPYQVATITELQRANGKRGNAVTGGLLGFLAGAIGVSIAVRDGDAGSDRAQTAVPLAAAAAGAVIGQLARSTRWDVLSLAIIRPEPLVGTHVRARAAGTNDLIVEGDVTELSPDSLTVTSRGGGRVRVSRQTSLVEWPYRTKPATVHGIAVGAGIGAATGVLLGFTGGADCSEPAWFCISRGQTAGLLGSTFGVLGGIVGGVAGALGNRVSWEHGARRAPQLNIMPSAGLGRAGFVARFTF